MNKLNKFSSKKEIKKYPVVYFLFFMGIKILLPEHLFAMDSSKEELEAAFHDIKKGNSYQKRNFPYVYNEITEFGHTNAYTPKFEQCILKGVDRRELINSTIQFPASVHGRLTMKFARKTYCGSGVLVGPNHVLTAAHCLYKKSKGWATEVVFTPGQNKQDSPFGKVKGTVLISLQGYIDSKDSHYDLGMVILDKPIGNTTGWAGLVCLPDFLLKNREMNVTGYPSKKSKQLFTMENILECIDTEQFKYDIDTSGGQSGGAVWTKLLDYESGPYIVGIHAYGSKKFNIATRLSKEKFQKIIEWISDYQIKSNANNGIPFKRKAEEKDLNPREKKKIKKEIKKIAEKGETAIQNYRATNDFEMAKLYQFGTGGAEKDNLQAAVLYREAAKKGIVGAQVHLGLMYKNGEGVAQSNKKAIKWLSRATENSSTGCRSIQPDLGLLYFKEEDYEKSLKCFKSVIKNYKEFDKNLVTLCKDGICRIGQKYYEGNNVETNRKEAYKLFKLVEDCIEAQYILGKMYAKGEYVEKNKNKAIEYYKKAALQNHVGAQLGLAFLYDKKDDEKNQARATKFYRLVAQSGLENQCVAAVQYLLGLRYEYGQGTIQNKREAKKWHQKAAEQGYEKANERLNNLKSLWERFFG